MEYCDFSFEKSALHASGALQYVSYSNPAYPALLKLYGLKVGYSPTLVVSNVGSDPITLAGLLEAFAKQGGTTVNGNQLTAGIITDEYLPSLGDTSNSWVALFKQVHDQYDAKAPLDGQEPDPGRPGVGDQQRTSARSRDRPVRLRQHGPLRRHRRLHRCHQQRRRGPGGIDLHHGHVHVRPGHDHDRNPAAGTNERRPLTLTH